MIDGGQMEDLKRLLMVEGLLLWLEVADKWVAAMVVVMVAMTPSHGI